MFSTKTTAATAVLSLALVNFGCDSSTNPSSRNNLEGLVAAPEGERTPIFLKMPDQNLLAVIQRGYDIHFLKTSSGYAEAGVHAEVPGAGGGYDFSVSGVYGEITPAEVLAYFDYDWRPIYDSVIQHSAASDRPINPILVRNALEREVCSLDELGEARSRDSEFQKLLELWRPEMEKYFRQAEQAYEEPVFSAFEPIEIEAYPAFVRLDDFTLLRISQDPYTVSFENPRPPIQIRFHKTAQGYGVTGVRGSLMGFGGGVEFPRSHIYTEITAAEALAYVDGDVDRLLRPIEIQRRAFEAGTIDLEAVRKALRDSKR